MKTKLVLTLCAAMAWNLGMSGSEALASAQPDKRGQALEPPPLVSASQEVETEEPGPGVTPLTGIWYSTWYSRLGRMNWIEDHGRGSQNQFVADVDGDGLGDAVVFFDTASLQGDWYVALSTGDGFDPYTAWVVGHGVGSDAQFLADVNGDGRADAVVYFDSVNGEQGAWYVALANRAGNGFDPYTEWTHGHGFGSDQQLLGDVNGDGAADAVVFFDTVAGQQGSWYVALAKPTGDGFESCLQWVSGHGFGSTTRFLADEDGDGKDDAIAFFDGPGSWYVARSTGTAFGSYFHWLEGHGSGSEAQLLADIDGLGGVEAIAIRQSAWAWCQATPCSNAFWQTNFGAVLDPWNKAQTHAAEKYFVADVSGESTPQPIAFFDTFSEPGGGVGGTTLGGLWQVIDFVDSEDVGGYPTRIQYSGDANAYNLWGRWSIRYRPFTAGEPGQYDSGDPDVIDEHLLELSEAGIDFLVFDETNRLQCDQAGSSASWICPRSIRVAERIADWNEGDENPEIRFALAIGGNQYLETRAIPGETEAQWRERLQSERTASIRSEAEIVEDYFLVPGRKEGYQKIDGKPLLVVYYAQFVNEKGWVLPGAPDPGNVADDFTVKWALGTIAKSTPGIEQIAKDHYGWAYFQGPVVNDELMVVLPGFFNHDLASFEHGVRASRDCGRFYEENWSEVLGQVPDTVVIVSYNDFTEETAIQRSDTSELFTRASGFGAGYSEKWDCFPADSDSYYSEKTAVWNQEYRERYLRRPLERYYSQAANDHWVTTGMAGPGYVLESTLGLLLPRNSPEAGTILLHECEVGGTDHMLSADANCEGQTVLRPAGRIYTQWAAGRRALYRCRDGSDHFVSPDAGCEGRVFESLLGYALDP